MKAVELNDAASEHGTKALNVTDRANGCISAYASLCDELKELSEAYSLSQVLSRVKVS